MGIVDPALKLGLMAADSEMIDSLLDEYLPTDTKEMTEVEREMAEYAMKEMAEAERQKEAWTAAKEETQPATGVRDSLLDGKELGSFANTDAQRKVITREQARETLSRPAITDEEKDE